MVEDMLRLEINGEKNVEDQDQSVLVDCTNTNIQNAKGFKKREQTHRGKRRAKGDFEAALGKRKKKSTQQTQVTFSHLPLMSFCNYVLCLCHASDIAI